MRGYCSACDAIVPVVRQVAGKAIGAIVGGLLGSTTETWWGIGLGAGLTALLGHAVDEAIGAVCGKCGRPIEEIEEA